MPNFIWGVYFIDGVWVLIRGFRLYVSTHATKETEYAPIYGV